MMVSVANEMYLRSWRTHCDEVDALIKLDDGTRIVDGARIESIRLLLLVNHHQRTRD